MASFNNPFIAGNYAIYTTGKAAVMAKPGVVLYGGHLLIPSMSGGGALADVCDDLNQGVQFARWLDESDDVMLYASGFIMEPSGRLSWVHEASTPRAMNEGGQKLRTATLTRYLWNDSTITAPGCAGDAEYIFSVFRDVSQLDIQQVAERVLQMSSLYPSLSAATVVDLRTVVTCLGKGESTESISAVFVGDLLQTQAQSIKVSVPRYGEVPMKKEEGPAPVETPAPMQWPTIDKRPVRYGVRQFYMNESPPDTHVADSETYGANLRSVNYTLRAPGVWVDNYWLSPELIDVRLEHQMRPVVETRVGEYAQLLNRRSLIPRDLILTGPDGEDSKTTFELGPPVSQRRNVKPEGDAVSAEGWVLRSEFCYTIHKYAVLMDLLKYTSSSSMVIEDRVQPSVVLTIEVLMRENGEKVIVRIATMRQTCTQDSRLYTPAFLRNDVEAVVTWRHL